MMYHTLMRFVHVRNDKCFNGRRLMPRLCCFVPFMFLARKFGGLLAVCHELAALGLHLIVHL